MYAMMKDVVEYFAWLLRSAWNSVGTLNEAAARQQYVTLVSQLFPSWQPDDSSCQPHGTPAGPVFSSLAHAGGGVDLPTTLVSRVCAGAKYVFYQAT